MLIGCPREIKNREYRVGLTPESARELVRHGHAVWIETGAGLGIGADDAQYRDAGAKIVDTAHPIFAECEMVVKVKEPQAKERAQLREGQILYTYLHLAPDPEQTAELVASGVTAIAYETVTGPGGTLPLLKPMSQVAGRMSIQAGATALEKAHGGRGRAARRGARGHAGHGGGDRRRRGRVQRRADGGRARRRRDDHGQQPRPARAARHPLRKPRQDALLEPGQHRRADLPRGPGDRGGAGPGAAAPKLVTRDMLGCMKPGAVLVDVAIDQGGCFETSHPTTHDEPTYVVDGIVHYCVANMPGAVSRTSTYALNNVTLPRALKIAELGWQEAMRQDPHLAAGLNVHAGRVTYPAVAEELGYELLPVEQAIG